ncbi:major capsid protein [Streptomyces sp. TRM43335]|uniref:Major capsid protein n=1 Tax=Streptomyces taklimakanensis TaxID=2569853 RepID=A0A6G2BDS9_9ACTN|nr:major capsid protein [Streptomyces taklimakanensis]MTE20286.1 major capsid protein [Streptomyces taklimakanensis]
MPEQQPEIPENIRILNDDELADALNEAVSQFDAKASSSIVTSDDLSELRELAATVDHIRQEQQARHEAAQQAAAEIDALAAKVRGGEDTSNDDDTEDDDTEDGDEAEASSDPEPEPAAQPEQVTASTAITRRSVPLNLSSVRSRQPRVLPEPPAPGTTITAAVDVPGYTPGAPLDFDDVTRGIISRATALKTAGGGVGQVISYRHPFERDLIVTDSSSAPEGTTVSLAASNQRRLPQQDLVASGGWCAPSETLYELTDVACPDMLWDAPEIQLARGGLRYYKTPSLDVGQLTWVHTEADDISGATKPCFKIPCPDPIEVRCDAVGVCLEAGILTQRHFPELVSWYLRNTMVAHEIRIRQELFNRAVATATPVTLAPTFGALSAIYAAVALQAADMIERHSLCEGTALEVVFPWWSRNLFLADLARRNGCCAEEVTPSMVQDVFSPLGVRIQWARGLTPAVPTDIGGPTPAAEWPEQIQFLIYPSGSLQIGRGEEINLGAIHDSTKFQTNDYTALFAEECVALVDRSVDTRIVTVPVCPSGETGAQSVLTCATS